MRVAIVEIESTIFGHIMRGRDDATLTSDWPADAKIIGGEWSLDRGRLRLLIESSAFDDVPDGNIAPNWTPTLTAHAVEPSAQAVMHLIDRMSQEDAS